MKRNTRKSQRTGGRFAAVTTCISTTLVLLLLGLVVMFVCIGSNFSRQLREELTVEVMLRDSLSTAQMQAVGQRLRQAPYARRVNYISKEQGTREMNEALQGDMGQFVGASPIPAEYEVYLRSDYANLDSLNHYEASIKALPGVSDIDYPRDVMQNLDRTLPGVGLGMLIVAALLALVSFSLINNTVRMNVYARRFSIQTMKLVGASWGFIRRPYLWQALRIGLLSAIIAGGLLAGALYYMRFVAGAGDIYFNQLITPLVWAATLGTVVICGVVLTVWCAYVSVNRHLRLSAGEAFIK